MLSIKPKLLVIAFFAALALYMVPAHAAAVDDFNACSDESPSGAELCPTGQKFIGDALTGECKSQADTQSTLDACDSASLSFNCSTGSCLSSCGDGVLSVGEQCDDGNTSPGDGCSSSCRIETSAPPPVCGDGIITSGEVCDGGSKLDFCSIGGKAGFQKYVCNNTCDSWILDLADPTCRPSSQWLDSTITPGDIYYDGGNVGIGTVAQPATLDVVGDATITNNLTVGSGAFTVNQAGDINTTGGLDVNGPSVLTNTVVNDLLATGNASINGDLSVIGNIGVNNALMVGGGFANGGITLLGGNLQVANNIELGGDLFQQNLQVLDVQNNTINLNSGATANVVAGATLDVNRPDGPADASLKWNEATDKWEFSDDLVAPAFIGDLTPSLPSCAADEVLQWDGASWICGQGGKWLDGTGAEPNEIYYSGGNVGIGVADPTAALDVAGNIVVGGKITGDRLVLNEVIPTNAGGHIQIIRPDNTNQGVISFYNTAINGQIGTIGMNSNSDNFRISSFGGADIILSGGNVGIGTNTPSQKLSVKGGAELVSNSQLDQEIIANGGGYGSTSHWQSFTVGITGKLDGIAVETNADISSCFIRVYQGEGVAGTKIYDSGSPVSVSANTLAYEWKSLPLTNADYLPINVIQGQQYTLSISGCTPNTNMGWHADGDIYVGGRSDVGSNVDLALRTYVDTAGIYFADGTFQDTAHIVPTANEILPNCAADQVVVWDGTSWICGQGSKWLDGTTAGDIYYGGGKVGINNQNPSSVLTVSQNADNTLDAEIALERTLNNKKFVIGVRDEAYIKHNGSGFSVYDNSSGSDVVRLNIDGQGRVGIGNSNVNLAQLHIKGVSSSTIPLLRLDAGSVNADNYISFQQNTGVFAEDGWIGFKGGQADLNIMQTNSGNGDLILGTNGVERLRITNSGKVGIGTGTTTPNARLEVVESVGENGIWITGGANGANPNLYFQEDAGAYGNIRVNESNSDAFEIISGQSDIVLQPGANKNVLIGGGYDSVNGTGITLSPDGTLQVGGDIVLKGNLYRENLQELNVQNNTILLNSGSVAYNDAYIQASQPVNGTNGSLKWDATAQKWMAGLAGAEAELVDVSSAQTLSNKTVSGNLPVTAGDITLDSDQKLISGGNEITIDNDTGNTLGGANFLKLTAANKVVIGVDSTNNGTGDFRIGKGGTNVGGTTWQDLLVVDNAGNTQITGDLTVATDTLVTSGGNVGIGGLSSTDNALTVTGTTPNKQGLYVTVSPTTGGGTAIVGQGINGATGGYFTSDTGYGLIVPNGNVGIGITTPATALDVVGSARIGVNHSGTIGTNSLAVGDSNQATGFESIALGNSVIAGPGEYAFAAGVNATASGAIAIAIGENVTASGVNSIVFGSNSSATGDGAVSIGDGSNTDGIYSGSLGSSNFVYSNYSAAVGSDNTVGDSATPGTYNNSLALGGSNFVKGTESVALGYNHNITADNAVAIGTKISIGGNYSLGINLSNTQFAINTPNVMAIMNGNVGIGTTVPNGKLDVEMAGADVGNNPVWAGYFVNDAISATASSVNKNGLYVSSTGGFSSGDGTTKNYGLYVDSTMGADANYSAYFADSVGIGVPDPSSALEVGNGDIYTSQPSSGMIMKSPNGSCYKLTVDDSGALSTSAKLCPDIGLNAYFAFVTNTTYTGNLSGLAGGDAKCVAEANAANLPNPNAFKAWLSDSLSNAKDRLVPINENLPYELVDGTIIANDWAGLLSGTLLAPINKTAKNIFVSDNVWTGTNNAGIFIDGCGDWLDTSQTGALGSTQDSTSWSSSAAPYQRSICDQSLRLYCIQQ